MAISTVSICNQALGWLGADSILSLGDDSKEAQLCKDNFDALRDAVLEEREWTFAVRRLYLTPLVAIPVYGYANQFLLPPNVLRVLNIPATSLGSALLQTGGRHADQNQGLKDWRVESVDAGRVILTNTAAVHCRVIWRVINEKIWSSMFIQALAARLAADLAMPLVNSRALQADMWKLYGMKLDSAATMDGMQGKGEVKRSSNLTDVR